LPRCATSPSSASLSGFCRIWNAPRRAIEPSGAARQQVSGSASQLRHCSPVPRPCVLSLAQGRESEMPPQALNELAIQRHPRSSPADIVIYGLGLLRLFRADPGSSVFAGSSETVGSTGFRNSSSQPDRRVTGRSNVRTVGLLPLTAWTPTHSPSSNGSETNLKCSPYRFTCLPTT
jgi:hypothetical protein